MSSILKALKKVENDPAGRLPVPDGSGRIHLKGPVIHGREKPPARWKGILGIAGVLCILLIGGFMFSEFYRRDRLQTPPDTIGNKDRGLERPEGFPEGRQTDPRPGEGPSVDTRRAGVIRKPESLPLPAAPKDRGILKTAERKAPVGDRRTGPRHTAGKTAPAERPGASSEDVSLLAPLDPPRGKQSPPVSDAVSETGPPVPSAVRQIPAAASEDAFLSIPVLAADRLHLHAVAWSPSPAERMAVINERIVREGESTEGFSLVHIGADYIIVREDGVSWRLQIRR